MLQSTENRVTIQVMEDIGEQRVTTDSHVLVKCADFSLSEVKQVQEIHVIKVNRESWTENKIENNTTKKLG